MKLKLFFIFLAFSYCVNASRLICNTKCITKIENTPKQNRLTNTNDIDYRINIQPTNIIYIDKDATGNNDGTSWTDAFNDISNALANLSNDDEVWIKGGTYIPNASGNSAVGITIIATGVKIYGGFAGTETQLSQRVFGANETIISGDVNNNDGTAVPAFTQSQPTTIDNIGTLMSIENFSGTTKTVLDGITFTRAYWQIGGGTLRFRGSVYPNISINNCKFILNLQRLGGGIYSDYFGGLSTQNSANLGITINQSVFDRNVSKLGSALFILNQDEFSNTFVTANNIISNSLFSQNIATDDPGGTQGQSGSAMFISQADPQSLFTTNINNCTFVNNKELATVLPTNERFVVTLGASPNASVHDVVVANNIFWDNQLPNGSVANSVGGGLPVNWTTESNIAEDNFANIPVSSQNNTINSNPNFLDASNDDYSLQNNSPAINSGNNAFVVGNFDLLNNPRTASTTVDLGAFEFNSSLSIHDYELNNTIKLYPNPVRSVLNIQTTKKIHTIRVISVLGKTIKTFENTRYLDLSELNTGVYLLKIETHEGFSSTIRFIKK